MGNGFGQFCTAGREETNINYMKDIQERVNQQIIYLLLK